MNPGEQKYAKEKKQVANQKSFVTIFFVALFDFLCQLVFKA